MTREYLASVHGVDRNLGRLLSLLDELKLAENTLVVFTSDHGYNLGHNGIWHKGNGHWVLTEPPPATPNIPKGQRPNLYDHSLRVPCIVRWPGVVKPGTVVVRTVTMLDWFPTLLAAAGVEEPKDVPVRGRNVLPLLRDDAAARRRGRGTTTCTPSIRRGTSPARTCGRTARRAGSWSATS